MEVRLSHEEKARIVAAAAVVGQSENAYATSSLVFQADEILKEDGSFNSNTKPSDVTD